MLSKTTPMNSLESGGTVSLVPIWGKWAFVAAPQGKTPQQGHNRMHVQFGLNHNSQVQRCPNHIAIPGVVESQVRLTQSESPGGWCASQSYADPLSGPNGFEIVLQVALEITTKTLLGRVSHLGAVALWMECLVLTDFHTILEKLHMSPRIVTPVAGGKYDCDGCFVMNTATESQAVGQIENSDPNLFSLKLMRMLSSLLETHSKACLALGTGREEQATPP